MRPIFTLLIFFSLTFCKSDKLPTSGVFLKITGNGMTKPSYLLGTFHEAGGMQILDSIKAIDSILISADQLIGESIMDFSDFDPSKKINQEKNAGNHFKPWPDADSTYENLLSERQRIVYDSVINTDEYLHIVKPLNYRPIVMLDLIKSSFNKEKRSKVKLKDLPVKLNSIPDVYLQNKAKKSGLNIIGLETREEVQSLKDSLNGYLPLFSYKDEIELLMHYVENHARIDSMKEMFLHEALNSYLAQDLNQMMKPQFKQTDDISPTETVLSLTPRLKNYAGMYNELIINARNRNWLRKIPGLIENKTSLIAVGAGHLGEKEGIINQLRLLGYRVERVK